MIRNGYGPFKPQGQYLISSSQDDRGLPQVGQIRVSFEYDRCSDATIIAQMIPDDKLEEQTFRKWIPGVGAQRDSVKSL